MYYNNYNLRLLTCFVFYSIFKDSDAFSFHNLYCIAGASTCDFSRCCCFSLATRRGQVTDADTREERLVLNHPCPRRALSGVSLFWVDFTGDITPSYSVEWLAPNSSPETSNVRGRIWVTGYKNMFPGYPTLQLLHLAAYWWANSLSIYLPVCVCSSWEESFVSLFYVLLVCVRACSLCPWIPGC